MIRPGDRLENPVTGEVLEGLLGLRLAGRKLLARPGDVALVPPGTPPASGMRPHSRPERTYDRVGPHATARARGR